LEIEPKANSSHDSWWETSTQKFVIETRSVLLWL